MSKPVNQQAENYKNKGNDEFKKGNHGKAIEYYTYATEMDPNNHIYFTNRSFAYYKMGENEKSHRDADKSVKKNPQWAKGYYRAGMALMELNRAAEAHESFKQAMNIDPSNKDFKAQCVKAKAKMMEGMSVGEILKGEGNDLFKCGDMDNAVKKYTEALEHCKDDEAALKADILANRAACNRQLYQPDLVINDCSEALELVPNHIKALIRRAQAYESVERYKHSLADFEMVCRLSPNTDVAIAGQARVRTALKRMAM
jgi:tetratricopeptide (TPR) repeat protein